MIKGMYYGNKAISLDAKAACIGAGKSESIHVGFTRNDIAILFIDMFPITHTAIQLDTMKGYSSWLQ